MFCGNCGKEIKEGNKFCTNCGTPVEVVNQSNSSITSAIQSAKCVTEYLDETIVDKMDSIKFGKYPQSDIKGKKVEDIEWLVLEKQKDKALLISKYVIDQVPFFRPGNDDKATEEESNWEVSFVREYLNDVFFNKAFNDNEQSQILKSTIKYSMYKNFDWEKYSNRDEILKKYPNKNIHANNTNDDVVIKETNDKIFLISYEDYVKYFGMEKIVIDNYHSRNDYISHTELENNKGTAKFTKYISEENFDLPDLCYALQDNEYTPDKSYRKFIYKGYQTVIHDIEKDKETGCCWFLNSVDWSVKLREEDGSESYRRPIFVGTHGDVACGNSGCVGGYGLRPAIWVRL